MATLTVATIQIYKAASLEVLWTSNHRYEIRDETGRIGNPRGYGNSDSALRAAARIASNRYNDALLTQGGRS